MHTYKAGSYREPIVRRYASDVKTYGCIGTQGLSFRGHVLNDLKPNFTFNISIVGLIQHRSWVCDNVPRYIAAFTKSMNVALVRP